MLLFTGDSEVSTGNWCFKDGVITFQDIYDLYIKLFRGKRLAIVSDCSYSGNWVEKCAKVYDKYGIQACGHYSKESSSLVNIFTSCKADQEATILAYVSEAMEFRAKLNDVIFYGNKTLSSSSKQTTIRGHFHMIHCEHKPGEPCQYTLHSNQTWEKKLSLWPRLYLVPSTDDRGSAAVLVDEDKVQQFEEQLATGTMNVADYGTVLYSGLGKNGYHSKSNTYIILIKSLFYRNHHSTTK